MEKGQIIIMACQVQEQRRRKEPSAPPLKNPAKPSKYSMSLRNLESVIRGLLLPHPPDGCPRLMQQQFDLPPSSSLFRVSAVKSTT